MCCACSSGLATRQPASRHRVGIKRERDPFVFSKEIAYFVNGGPLTRATKSVKLQRAVSEEELKAMSESILTEEGELPDDSEIIDDSLKSRTFKDFEALATKNRLAILDAFGMQGMNEHLGTNHFRSGFGRNWGGIGLRG